MAKDKGTYVVIPGDKHAHKELRFSVFVRRDGTKQYVPVAAFAHDWQAEEYRDWLETRAKAEDDKA